MKINLKVLDFVLTETYDSLLCSGSIHKDTRGHGGWVFGFGDKGYGGYPLPYLYLDYKE